MEIAEPKLTEKIAEKMSAKSIGRVQAKLAMHLGEEGWAVLQKAGEEADDIYEKLVTTQINYQEATKLIAEILEE